MKRASFALSFVLASIPLFAFADDTDPAPLAPDPAPYTYRSPQQPADEPAVAIGLQNTEPRYDLLRVNAGVEVGYVTDRGYDMFSTNDALTTFSLDATYPLLTRGNFVLAAGLGWKGGGSSATTRGASTDLRSHRFLVPIEARWHPGSALFVFAKVAPGARLSSVDIDEASSQASLSDSAWSFATDMSVGTSILLGPSRHFEKKAPRLWVTPEFGYAYATNASLSPNPGRDSDDILGADASSNLRSLAMSGFFWRASVGMTF